jgi:hypothetical protein
MEDNSIRHTIKIIATLTTLIPISAGILRYKTAGKNFRLFLFYLCYGFLTDVLVWQLVDVSYKASFYMFIFFPLAEALFLLWFIKATNASPLISKICNILFALMIPFWFCEHFVFNSGEHLNAVFDTAYEIIISILSAYSLLKIGETQANLSGLPLFWFQLGVFIYSFTTFFLSGFLGTELLQRIWFMNNLINLLVYLLFTKAFLSIKEEK